MTRGRRFRPPRGGLVVLVAVAGLLVWAPAFGLLEAQSRALGAVEEHITAGRFPEARETLERWWLGEAEAPRQERQQALWLRARLTVDPALAELDYRRLVVEFPGGEWSDQALLRLAQGAEFRGDRDAARQYLGILERDYPRSPLRVEARDRLARLDAAADGEAAPSPAEAPPAEEPGSPFPQGEPPGEPDSPAPVSSQEDPGGEPLPREGAFTIQLGAFSSEERARDHAAVLQAAGLEVRVVQVEGSPLFRVRMGDFSTRDEAVEAAGVPRRLGFEAVVGGDRERERPRP